jgi:hypothetical protein
MIDTPTSWITGTFSGHRSLWLRVMMGRLPFTKAAGEYLRGVLYPAGSGGEPGRGGKESSFFKNFSYFFFLIQCVTLLTQSRIVAFSWMA